MEGTIGAVWGIVGIMVILGGALYRLFPLAVDAFLYPFQWYHWLAYAANVLLMAYAEGFRGFQTRFSPRVASRALYLQKHPRLLDVALAPLFCMGYFHSTGRRKLISFSLTAAIVVLILAVHRAPQPWRGIIDGGVVVGLVWGLMSVLWFSVLAVIKQESSFPPDIPEPSATNLPTLPSDSALL